MAEDKSSIIFNISGGNNQILPNATKAEQHFYGDQFAKEALHKGMTAPPPLTDDERRLMMFIEKEESLRNYVAQLAVCKTAADVGQVVAVMCENESHLDEVRIAKENFIETLIPFDFVVPGVKLGLSNLVIVIMLYAFGWREALAVDVLKVILSGFLFGNAAMMLYSAAGALLSFTCMDLVRRSDRFSPIGVSVIGGVTHNVGQVLVAAAVVRSIGPASYLPALVLSGSCTGALLGVIASAVLVRIRITESD